jgi:hypothetical protein
MLQPFMSGRVFCCASRSNELDLHSFDNEFASCHCSTDCRPRPVLCTPHLRSNRDAPEPASEEQEVTKAEVGRALSSPRSGDFSSKGRSNKC